MRVDIIKNSGCEHTLNIIVDRDEIEEELESLYREVSKTTRIPGFRVGRVPRAILEDRMGKEVERKALERLLRKAYEEAIKETRLIPITPPRIEDVDYRKGEALSFKAHLETKPEFQLDGYKDIHIRKRIKRVSQDDVEKRLRELQGLHAEMVNVEGRGVKKGDIIQIDYQGLVDGDPIPGARGERISIEVGKTRLLPGLEEEIIGMEPGEERDIAVILPEDYPVVEFRGEEAIFKVRLHSIKERHLPQIDDEFAKDLGKSNLLELRASIEEELKRLYQMEGEEGAKKELLNALVSMFDFPIPKGLIEGETDLLINGFANNLATTGMDLTGYLKKNNLTMEALREDFRVEAKKRLKRGFILDAIADKEGIQVTEDDISKEIENMARAFGITIKEMKERIIKEDGMEDLQQRIRVEKTLTYLLGQSRVEEIIE